MKSEFLTILFCAVAPLAQTADEPRYRINTDYDEPRSKDTFLYAVFTLDHDQWPKVTQVAFSRFGFCFVFERIAERRYRLTPLPLAPHEFQQVAALLHDQVRFTSIRSQSKSKHDPYLLRVTAAFSRPSISYHDHGVYADAAEAVRPLLEPLRRWQQRARDIWAAPPEPEKGPHAIATLETEDDEFLDHMMSSLHYTSTWRPTK